MIYKCFWAVKKKRGYSVLFTIEAAYMANANPFAYNQSTAMLKAWYKYQISY
jgi:hypothetical protein